MVVIIGPEGKRINKDTGLVMIIRVLRHGLGKTRVIAQVIVNAGSRNRLSGDKDASRPRDCASVAYPHPESL